MMSSGTGALRVAVVGSGIAGLATAWELSRRGFAVSLLEREAHPGGRTCGETVEGFRLDATGPLVSTGDRRLLAWVRTRVTAPSES